MVAGMASTTVKGSLVGAILSAGYHVEVAGSGHYNPPTLRAKVAEIQSNIPVGISLTLNLLSVNSRHFLFQLPL